MPKASLFTRGIAVVAALMLPAAALAQGASNFTNLKEIANDSLAVINIVVTIVFVLAILVFGWGIVKYIASAGNPEKEKEARRFLWWGVIGIFVLAAVFGIVKWLGTSLGTDLTGGTIIIPKVENPR